jgi:hypothetical protein
VGWDVALNPVLAELAAAIPVVSDLEAIIQRSGMPPGKVRTSARADVYWQNVLSRAGAQEGDVLDHGLDLASEDSGSEALRDAVQRYRDGRGS